MPRRLRTRVTPIAPIATVAIGGRTFTACYDFRALALLFELTGINLLHGWNAADFAPGPVVAFVFAGLQRHHPEVEYAWIAEHLDLGNYEEILVALRGALGKAMPDKKAEEAGADPGNA